ncbi:MAG TPA: PIG-L family deacetylase [Methylomirabilota bacterium]|nr:PIG-L family deacetylase [Methylomirabilota bacterium]
MKTTTTSRGPARRTRQVLGLALAASLLAGCSGLSRAAELPVDPDILQQLRSFATMGSVLYIAAHPDDENTRVITYLARGRGYRTAYLSLTRGDGGQNLLGPQFREQLGVARTQELLAARRLDGGRQYFTRAKDFGFSKDYQDTLRIWDRQAVLADIVRVIRSFRPDVIVTRFSPQPGNTHGHHTASTILAVEAFKLAGDPRAFPEQLGELTPWQPKRILHNVGVGGAGAGAAGGNGTGVVKMDIGGNDPVLGEPFASIAARSRAMHKTQGFDVGLGVPVGPSRTESFVSLGGEPAAHDILDGVDTTWNRVPGGAEIGRLTEEAIARFKPEDPAASVPALLAIRSRVSVLPANPVVSDKRQQLDRIIQAFIGLEVETLVDQPEAVPGETLKMRHTAVMRSGLPVRWTAVRYPSIQRAVTTVLELRANQSVVRDENQILPATTPPSQPYWLRKEGTAGLFQVDNPSLIGRPENPAAFPIEYVFEVGGQTLVISGEPVQAADPANATMRRRLDVIPPVSLRFVSDVQLFAPGATRPVTVELTAARASVAGTVQLEGPTGWRITASQPFHLAEAGEHARFTFTVTAPAQLAMATLEGSVEVNGLRFNTQRIELRYNHIPFQLLQPVARLKAVSLDLAIRGRHIGYLAGAGDDVAGCLERMGYAVTQLTGADLIPDKLRPLDAVVIGIRAFNTRKDLAGHLPALFEYVEAGGNVIAQYNLSDGLGANWLAPFRLRISRDRVTDEHAPVTFLAPDHPVLTRPNRITRADFDGWVQERGLYFPDQWDERFSAILASGDPGEMPLRGGLLVARHGKGYFVYTSLAWFRQLPEGVPGAYRLFANLVSLGK